MEFNDKKVLTASFVRDIKKGKYNMKHDLQRKEGQWKNYDQSLLIDSILRNYPVDPIRVEEKEDKIKYVFDGVQRSTTLRDFLADEFSLSNKLKPVIIDGVTYEIADKKYSQLDEEVKTKIDNYGVIVYIFSDCTDEDIKEMFRRQNNGKPLSNTQKRKVYESEAVSNVINELTTHPLFEKILTKSQIKKDVENDMVRQTLMLINSIEEHDFTSFRAKDIDNFVIWYDQNINENDLTLLKSAFEFLNDGIEELNIKATSIPMMLWAAYEVVKQGKSFDLFINAVVDFAENYGSNIDYIALCSGTTSHASVQGRFDYWKNIVENLVEEPVTERSTEE